MTRSRQIRVLNKTGDEPSGYVSASQAEAPFQVRRSAPAYDNMGLGEQLGMCYVTLVSEVSKLSDALRETSRFPNKPKVEYVIVDARNQEVIPDIPAKMMDPTSASNEELPL